MAPNQATCGDNPQNPWSKKKSVNIELQKHDVSLALEIPDSGLSSRHIKGEMPQDAPDDQLESFPATLLAHAEFKAQMHGDQLSSEAFDRRCRTEVSTIELFFPGRLSGGSRICFVAWLSFACAMDDILETLSADEGEAVLYDCIEIFQGRAPPGAKGNAIDTRIQHLAGTLHKHCARYLAWSTCFVLFREISAVFYAHIDEFHFMDGRTSNDLSTYMTIRSRTISMNPFFEVIKWECLPPEWRLSAVWEKLQYEVSCVTGLQNDLIGLERDLEGGEQLNAVVVLLRSQKWDSSHHQDEALLAQCIARIAAEHNKSVARVLTRVANMYEASNGALPDSVVDVVRHIVLLCETHLKWVMSAKRYRALSD